MSPRIFLALAPPLVGGAPELPGPPVVIDVAHGDNPVFRRELVAVDG